MIAIFARVNVIATNDDRCDRWDHMETIHSVIVTIVMTAAVDLQKFVSLRSQSVFRLQDCSERSSQTVWLQSAGFFSKLDTGSEERKWCKILHFLTPGMWKMSPKVARRTNQCKRSSRFQLNSIGKGQWKYEFHRRVFLLLNGVLDFAVHLVLSHLWLLHTYSHISLIDRSWT